MQFLKAYIEYTPVVTWAWILAVGTMVDVLVNRNFDRFLGAKWRNMLNGVVICGTLAIVAPLLVFCVRLLQHWVTKPLVPIADIPVNWIGQVTEILLYYVVVDLLYYWWHRSQHHIPCLWHMHAVHHSDPHVTFSSYVRQHWSELIAQAFVINFPLVVLFGNAPAPAAVAWLFTFWSFFIHTDIDVGAGWVSWVVTTPKQHRLHHSIDGAHHNSNFASYFPLWDLFFGSFNEGPRCAIQTGLGAEQNYIRGLQIDLLWPRQDRP
jgi:sterol desaturase/sphingolipid hydroxylase (fatty acid hydroxylase superfamily)